MMSTTLFLSIEEVSMAPWLSLALEDIYGDVGVSFEELKALSEADKTHTDRVTEVSHSKMEV